MPDTILVRSESTPLLRIDPESPSSSGIGKRSISVCKTPCKRPSLQSLQNKMSYYNMAITISVIVLALLIVLGVHIAFPPALIATISIIGGVALYSLYKRHMLRKQQLSIKPVLHDTDKVKDSNMKKFIDSQIGEKIDRIKKTLQNSGITLVPADGTDGHYSYYVPPLTDEREVGFGAAAEAFSVRKASTASSVPPLSDEKEVGFCTTEKELPVRNVRAALSVTNDLVYLVEVDD